MKSRMLACIEFLFYSNNNTYRLWLVLSVVFLLLEMYLNTGNLSAYAVTLDVPVIKEGYLVNLDYVHYECNYNFIVGNDLETWEKGWVLRRELFFILAFPFLKIFGFYIGGIVAAFTITISAYLILVRFVFKTFGLQQAYVAMVLFVSYPGIMYWIGSPFAQTMIVPCCCLIYILMWKINETQRLTKHLVYLSAIAVLFTAYDFFVFFYPAILLLCLKKRQWMTMLLSFPIVILPQLLIVWWLKSRGMVELSTDNSGLYTSIINSYINPIDYNAYWDTLKDVPGIFVNNFIHSSFLFLPLLFFIAIIWGYYKKIRLNTIEGLVLFCGLLVFLINNLAPSYSASFLMRGDWMARIYQPLFIVFIMYIVRVSDSILVASKIQKRILISLLLICFVGNVCINVGGIFRSKLTQWAWYSFYQHATKNTMNKNLRKYGAKPLGF